MLMWLASLSWSNITDSSGLRKLLYILLNLCIRFLKYVKYIQACSVTKSYLTLCDPMDCSMLGFPVLHCLLEFAQTHVHQFSDDINHLILCLPLLLLPSIFPSISLFQWVSSSHQVAKLLELQLQHQSFQRIFRTDERLLLWAVCYTRILDLQRRGFWSGVRDEAWLLGAFCVAKFY